MNPPRNDTSGKSTDFLLGEIHSQNVMIQQTLSEDRLASAQYRTEVRKELREQNERMSAIETKLNGAVSDIAEMKPKVGQLEQNDSRRQGARDFAFSAGSFLKGALQLLFGGLGGALAIMLDKMLHR